MLAVTVPLRVCIGQPSHGTTNSAAPAPPTRHYPQDGGMAALPEPSEEMAHLPRVIRTLVQRRRTVKDLIKREADPVGGRGMAG